MQDLHESNKITLSAEAEKYVYYRESNPDLIIMLGNCLEIMPLLPKADLVVTDPPYGVNIASKGTVGVGVMAKLKEYEASDWDMETPSSAVFDMIRKSAKSQIIWGGNYFTDKLPQNKCWICWDKKIPKGFTKAQIELAWTNMATYSRIYSVLWHGMIRERSESDAERYHPTQKPTKLIRHILNDFSGNVFDPFMGSGTTLVACKELNRNGIGIEISEQYCEIAKTRLKTTCRSLF